MIALAIPNLTGNEAAYLKECVDTNFVSTVGPFVTRFEELLAKICNTRGAVATITGTAALHAMLTVLDVRPGRLVVLPSFTFIASANAVSYTGATPAFVDIDPASLTMDAGALDAFLAQARANGLDVAAVMPVHALGHPADGPALQAVCNAHSVPMVCDSAAALGATCHGRPAPTLGRAAVLSFNGNKTITCGGGGAIISDDETFLHTVRHLTTTARVSADYEHDVVGFNYRMTNLNAAVGCAQLERLDELVGAKRRIAARYAEAFSGRTDAAPFPTAQWAESAAWFSGIVLARGGEPAEALIAGLAERGVMARHIWQPMHLQPPYRNCPRGPMDVTEDIWGRMVTLPCSTGLTDAEQAQVIAAVEDVLRGMA